MTFKVSFFCAFSSSVAHATILLMKKLIFCIAFVLLLYRVPVSAQDGAGLMGRINNLRTSVGLPAYTWNSALAAAAQSQAQWMVDTGTIAHARPDGSTPRARAMAAGYTTTEVSENIYGGTNATSDDAWNFWINSAIHYAGLTNARYKEVGVGIASGGWGSAYVLVFGNPGGAAYVPPAASGGGGNSAASGPPSYVVGLDSRGNIMHEIQPGDTLGDIALIYGYTWADIPTMVALNGLNQNDYRDLEVGSIFLVPPKAGTYTPTPGDAPTSTPESASATPEPVTATPGAVLLPDPTLLMTDTPAPTFTPVVIAATANSVPAQVQILIPTHLPTVTPEAVALVNTPAGDSGGGVTITPNNSPPVWLIIGLVVQVGVLLVAGIELLRRLRRR